MRTLTREREQSEQSRSAAHRFAGIGELVLCNFDIIIADHWDGLVRQIVMVEERLQWHGGLN